jgi:hypothetical protein
MNEPSKTQPPEWAVTFARGALRIGMRVPEIEQHLVSRGLSADEANGIVMGLVEGDVRQQAAPLAETEYGKPIRLLLSLAICGACLALAYWYGAGLSVGRSLIFLFPVLGSIWVPALTDTEDSDWGARSLAVGWLLLFLYLGYRIYLCVILWLMVH